MFVVTALMTVYTMSVFVADWILRGLSITGRMFVAAAFMCIYVMPPELRSFGLGSCSMLSRIGGLASPYVADLVSDERLEVDLVRMRA